MTDIFLSTYPVRGTTMRSASSPPDISIISIHVPRAGYDEALEDNCIIDRDFYPRTPCGVRHGTDPRGSSRA